MNRREQIEAQEEQVLAPYACTSKRSSGRKYLESKDEYRTCFQRDRDRIIHTKAYRRLQGKTQVFMIGEGDHYRNRLTHTNEVTQIARDLARALRLNEDLSESIALAHDLGHTPFGHAGEDALNEMMKKYGKCFEHNEQSQRIVAVLESPYPTFTGLNLTHEVLEGIAKHKSVYDQNGKVQTVETLEAQVVNLADEIAYHHHDLDDGLRGGLIFLEDIKNLPLIHEGIERTRKEYPDLPPQHFKKRLLTTVLRMLMTDVIRETEKRIRDHRIESLSDVKRILDAVVHYSPSMQKEVRELATYLYQHVYVSPPIRNHAEEAGKIIKSLFDRYYERPETLPEEEQERMKNGEEKEDVVKDYIAGMTDHFAIDRYKSIYPKKRIKAIQLQLLSD